MNENTLKLNYVRTAVQAMEKLAQLSITDADEDRSIKQLIRMLRLVCSGYDGTFKETK